MSNSRGYGSDHERERRRMVNFISSGYATCARCGGEILPGDPFDLDHTDDRTGYLGPSHPRCNRSAGGKRGGRTSARRRRVQAWSRQWLSD